jgi:hypothetical protein
VFRFATIRKYRHTLLATEIEPLPLATLRYVADIETLDQPVSHLKDVGHRSVGQEIAFRVTHHLMNFDSDFSLAVGRDLDGLDMRIDDRPLTFPIAADLITSVNVAAFHSVCPNVTGTFLIVAGVCFLLVQKLRMAATYLGAWIVLLVVVIYGPVLIGALADPSTGVQVEGLNYLADTLLFGGAILSLAGPTRSNRQWSGIVCGRRAVSTQTWKPSLVTKPASAFPVQLTERSPCDQRPMIELRHSNQ